MLDEFDISIIRFVSQAMSLQEMAEKLRCQTSKIQFRVRRLKTFGYIQDEPAKHRSRKLTEAGNKILAAYTPKR